MTVGVGEITGVAAPEHIPGGPEQSRPGGERLGDHPVDLRFTAHVVRQRDTPEGGAIGRQAGIFRQRFPRIERQPGTAQLEKGDPSPSR